MIGEIRATFEKYGESVTVRRGTQSVQTKAFIQPICAESGKVPIAVGPLGAVDERCRRYLGANDTEIMQGDRVEWDGKTYRVCRAEAVRAGNAITHYWAILREEATV